MFERTIQRLSDQVRRIDDLPGAVRVCATLLNERLISMAQSRFHNSESEPGVDWAALSTKPSSWPRRRERGDNAKPLVDTGRLMKSVAAESDGTSSRFGNPVEYAAVHQYGFRGPVTQSVKTTVRRAHTRQQKGKTVHVREHVVSGHERTIEQDIPARPINFDDETISLCLRDLVRYQLTGEVSP